MIALMDRVLIRVHIAPHELPAWTSLPVSCNSIHLKDVAHQSTQSFDCLLLERSSTRVSQQNTSMSSLVSWTACLQSALPTFGVLSSLTT